LVFEHPSLGRVAFVRQPIQSAIIQCPVGSLAKRTLPKRHSSSLARSDDGRPAGGKLVFEHPSLGRVAFVRQPIQSAIIQCSVGSLTKRTLPNHRISSLARSDDGRSASGELVFEHPSLGRVAFVRQPIQSAIIQCSVGSLAKRTLPELRSSSLGKADDCRPAGGKLVFEHPSLGRVAFVRQPIQSAIIQCSVGSLTKRTLPKRHSLGGPSPTRRW